MLNLPEQDAGSCISPLFGAARCRAVHRFRGAADGQPRLLLATVVRALIYAHRDLVPIPSGTLAGYFAPRGGLMNAIMFRDLLQPSPAQKAGPRAADGSGIINRRDLAAAADHLRRCFRRARRCHQPGLCAGASGGVLCHHRRVRDLRAPVLPECEAL